MAGGLSILDRAIGVLSPKWAAQRGYARGVLQDVDAWLGKRGFDAAKRGGRAAGWRGVGGSANAEIGPALDIIRKRARDMAQNDGWAANICAKLPAKIIGTGIVPRADSKDKGARERARDAWNAFVENSDPSGQSDFYGQSFLTAATVVRSGEALVRWYVRPKDFGLKVPLQCDVLEPDYLDTTKTEERPGGNLIIQGVEFDGFGRRVAYWLFPVHPGEVGGVAAMARLNRFQSQRVDAAFVDHVYRIDRPGQVRGVSWLAPVLMTMRDIADYEEAELVRKKIAACLAFFIKSKDGSAAGIGQVVREQGEGGAARPRIESVKPGRIHYLQPDEEPFSVDPNQSPSTGYADYLGVQLRKCAAGVGATYEMVSGDLSNVNYSSIREGKLDFWDTLDSLQWNMIVPQHCRPAWRRVMVASSLNGLKVATDLRAIWTPPKRPWVDPLKDVNAKVAELAAGLDSWPDAIAAQGHDPEDRIAEILEWLPRLLKAGVNLAKAGAPSLAKQANLATQTTAIRTKGRRAMFLPIEERVPLLRRSPIVEKVDASARTLDVVWTAGAEVQREDWWSGERWIEALEVSERAIRMKRLASGNAPVLDGHRTWGGVTGQLGVVERAWIDGTVGRATIRLGAREEIAGIVADILGGSGTGADGIIRNISVGYMTHARKEELRGGVKVRTATDWEPVEISYVPVPADPDSATMRSFENANMMLRGLDLARGEMCKTTRVYADTRAADARMRMLAKAAGVGR